MLKKTGYGLLIAAGMLVGPLAVAQGTAQAPATGSQANPSAQAQAGCPRGMMGGAGMGCPMAGEADVEIQQTPTGAILRLTAKSPDQVANVQQHAQMMASCMGGGQQAGSTSPQKTP